MSSRLLTIIIVISAIGVLAIWGVLFWLGRPILPVIDAVPAETQAANLEKKMQDLLSGDQSSRLKEFQKTLRAYVQLPLPLRLCGKYNPFLPVTEQPSQFSRPAAKSNPVNRR